MSLVSWNLDNLGSQDRSLAAAAVVAPPSCGITNPGPFCGGSVNVHMGPSGMDSYQWSFVSNSSGASFVGSTTDSSVMVNAGSAAGSYDLQLTMSWGGLSQSCDVVASVNVVSLTKSSRDVSCNGGSEPPTWPSHPHRRPIAGRFPTAPSSSRTGTSTGGAFSAALKRSASASFSAARCLCQFPSATVIATNAIVASVVTSPGRNRRRARNELTTFGSGMRIG